MKPHSLAMAIALSVGAQCAQANSESQQSSQNSIERLTIVSSRFATPIRELTTSVSIVTEEDIKARGYVNLADVLEVQPSINANNSGGLGTASALRIRGEEGFRTQIRIDGVEVSDPTGVQIGPQVGQLQSANVGRVEILRGTQGFAYGADAGGVINVQSRSYSETLAGSLATEYGRFDTVNVVGDIGGQTDKFDYYLGVSDFKTNGFNSRENDETQDNDGFDNTTAHLRVGYALSDNFTFGLVGRTNRGETEFDSCGFGATASNDCQSTFDQDNLRLHANYATEQSEHELAFSKTFVSRDFFNQNALTFFTEGTLERLEYVAKSKLDERSNLIYGFDWKQESITTTDTSRNNRGYHFEYQAEPVDNAFLTAGARLDDNDDFGTHVSYRVSGAYIVPVEQGEFKVRGAFGTGFRAPSLSELDFNRGPFAFPPAVNVELTEENSQGYEVGVHYTDNTGSSLEVVYFDQQIEDAIFFDLANFSGYLQDEGITDSQGVELIGNWLVTESVSLYGNFTYNKTTQADGSQRLRRPARLANMGMRFLGETLTYNVNVRYVSETQDIANQQIDDFVVIDISARYALSEKIEIYARVENLFDEGYREIAGFNTAGAAPHLGVRIQF